MTAVSPRLAGRWLYRLWFQTRRFPEPARETRWRQHSHELTLPWEGGNLRLYSWGEGPTVLLLHGWNGRGTQLGALAALLARSGYRAVALDAPGHGRSPGNSTSLFEIIQAVQRVAAAAGPFEAIVTHSFGAMVITRALRDGLGASSTVCIAPPARLAFLIDSFCATVGAPPSAKAALIGLLERRFGGDLEASTATDLNAAHLCLPGLIIHDREDREVPWQQGEAVARAWPGGRLMLTEGLGHNRILRDRPTLRAAVDFIAAVRRGASIENY
ncbi:MAG: alpha/beta hydrolase [Gammaproteobacteria bacterium]